ncbi:MAG: hypothetical protein WCK98_05365 [bacterium]
MVFSSFIEQIKIEIFIFVYVGKQILLVNLPKTYNTSNGDHRVAIRDQNSTQRNLHTKSKRCNGDHRVAIRDQNSTQRNLHTKSKRCNGDHRVAIRDHHVATKTAKTAKQKYVINDSPLRGAPVGIKPQGKALNPKQVSDPDAKLVLVGS